MDVFLSEGILHLVLEFCPHNLEEIIRNKSILIRSHHVKSYMQMMLSGLDCLHRNYILHRGTVFYTLYHFISLYPLYSSK